MVTIAAGALAVTAIVVLVAAGPREATSRASARPIAARISGSAYRDVDGALRDLAAARAGVGRGLRQCSARLQLGGFEAPPSCFGDVSGRFVQSAFRLWTALGTLDGSVAGGCRTTLRNLRFQLNLSATVVRQTDMAIQSLHLTEFRSLADDIPRLAPMESNALARFVSACSPA